MATDPEDLPDAAEQETTTNTTTAAQSTSKKRKKPSTKPPTTQFSIRHPTWSYIRLQHLSPTPNPTQDLDAMTAHMHLNAALSTFLGLHGSAITFDILKLEGQGVWIRVQAEDRAAVVAATGGWVSKAKEGWRMKGWSCWNAAAAAAGRDAAGGDLFDD